MIEVIIFSISLAIVFIILYSLVELVCCQEYKDYKTMIRTERRKRRFYRNTLMPKRRHSEPPRRRRKREHILAR